jgi:dolichyl-phosphate-mannose--protein O-mannosyl transferase
MNSGNDEGYWFKGRGSIGCSCPITWQGGIVLLLHIAGMYGSAKIFPPERQMGIFLAAVIGLTILFAVVYLLKREPSGLD